MPSACMLAKRDDEIKENGALEIKEEKTDLAGSLLLFIAGVLFGALCSYFFLDNWFK